MAKDEVGFNRDALRGTTVLPARPAA